ncbi:MAG: hypothetical protein K2P92_02730, partial [Bdellovibrionaceae bacterium]|nr:hypothetical protein [Pseudobdellovibrionaceae bacterium]
QYIDLDIIKFYESGEFLEYAHLARTASPQLAVHAWLAMRTNYTPVFAGDFIYFHNLLIFFNEKPISFKAPEYKDYAVDRIMKRHGRFGVSNFFNYSFEQLESFITYTRAGRSANFDNTGMYTKYHFRCAVYRDAGFNFMTWPGRQKFSGFEQVKTYFAERTGDMDAYENIFRRPLEDVFGGPADNMYIFVKKGHESLFGNILRELSANHAEEKRLGIVRVTP